MCSLGHHDHAEDVAAPNVRPPRAPRRHLEGTWTRIVAEMPRAVREENRTTIHARLEAELAGNVTAAAPFQGDFHEHMEPLPPGTEQLPDHLIAYDSEDKGDRRRQRSATFRATGDL
jgi:hypothetical protein